MTFDASNEPDWDRLSEINAEAEKLIADGELTEKETARLLAEGRKAVKGRTAFLEGLHLTLSLANSSN